MSNLDFKGAIGELTQAVEWLRGDQGCAKVREGGEGDGEE
jgi:hypothetical protein